MVFFHEQGWQRKPGLNLNKLQVYSRYALASFVAMVPSLILVIYFWVNKLVDRGQDELPLYKLIMHLLCNTTIASFSIWHIVISTIIGLIIYYIFWQKINYTIKNRVIQKYDSLLLVALVILLLYLIIPNDNYFISFRLNYYLFIIIILWISSGSYINVTKNIISILIVISLGFLSLTMQYYYKIDKNLEEYLTVKSYIKDNTTILPILIYDYDNKSIWGTYFRINPYINAGGYLTIDRCIVNLFNYQACKKYFPTSFNANLSPCGDIIKNDYSKINFENYLKRTKTIINYIIICGMDDENNTNLKNTGTILNQLQNENYQLIYQSKHKLMRVYQKE